MTAEERANLLNDIQTMLIEKGYPLYGGACRRGTLVVDYMVASRGVGRIVCILSGTVYADLLALCFTAYPARQRQKTLAVAFGLVCTCRKRILHTAGFSAQSLESVSGRF